MSKGAMTYEQAQDKIDDPNDNDELAVSLRHLLKLSKILKVPLIYYVSTCSTVLDLKDFINTVFISSLFLQRYILTNFSCCNLKLLESNEEKKLLR